MEKEKLIDRISQNVNTCSAPSQLKITDLRVAQINGAPKHCPLIKIYTNQGITGFGELRDASSATYALMLKSRIIGENPCNVDKLFRRIRQFAGPSRQGGGVSGIEIALWDIAGKAWGVPLWQMLGGKFRDRVRMYCDTDIEGRHTGADMGRALKARLEQGFTFLKMDLGIELLLDEPGCLSAPAGFLEDVKKYSMKTLIHQRGSVDRDMMLGKNYEIFTIPHHAAGIQITEKGLDWLENYVREIRDVIGYEPPLAIDHAGHIGAGSVIRLAKRLEKYNIAWLEDVAPWQYVEQYRRIAESTTVPICTGEDIYLAENFEPLMKAGGVSVVQPDILTVGGAMELKKTGDLCDKYGVAMAIHMAESPVGCMASIHTAAALQNVLAVEFHSVDVPWWKDIVKGLPDPLMKNGFIDVPDAPGLGIEDFNDEVISEHIHEKYPGVWSPTDAWDLEWSNDREWS
ncbi:MAG: mandelate racemase/muconate lactonizing enzyme family protein [Clostridia bacterium]|nr:mandelate racemase/muconate lactonizing enzyme family protein [Clostridia bacterium]